MKLRNKKTRDIIERYIIETASAIDSGLILQDNDTGKRYLYDSFAEFCADWEDYEEPEKYWFIDAFGNIVQNEITKHYGDEYTDMTNEYENQKEIGNHFESEEEAEKAVEKLKAWKRLSGLNFKFKGWRTADLGADKYYFVITAESDGAGKGDLDLLFGGEK